MGDIHVKWPIDHTENSKGSMPTVRLKLKSCIYLQHIQQSVVFYKGTFFSFFFSSNYLFNDLGLCTHAILSTSELLH